MRILLLFVLLYLIYKVIVRLVAPFFAGYHGANNRKQQASSGDSYQEQRKGKVTFRFKNKKQTPDHLDLNKADAEDADFEEIK